MEWGAALVREGIVSEASENGFYAPFNMLAFPCLSDHQASLLGCIGIA